MSKFSFVLASQNLKQIFSCANKKCFKNFRTQLLLLNNFRRFGGQVDTCSSLFNHHVVHLNKIATEKFLIILCRKGVLMSFLLATLLNLCFFFFSVTLFSPFVTMEENLKYLPYLSTTDTRSLKISELF